MRADSPAVATQRLSRSVPEALMNEVSSWVMLHEVAYVVLKI